MNSDQNKKTKTNGGPVSFSKTPLSLGATGGVLEANGGRSSGASGSALRRAAGAVVFLLLSSCACCPMCRHPGEKCCQTKTAQAGLKKEGLRAEAQAPIREDSLRLQQDLTRGGYRSFR